eukprot:15476167-Alexandrium_andersonii.AAC.1
MKRWTQPTSSKAWPKTATGSNDVSSCSAYTESGMAGPHSGSRHTPKGWRSWPLAATQGSHLQAGSSTKGLMKPCSMKLLMLPLAQRRRAPRLVLQRPMQLAYVGRSAARMAESASAKEKKAIAGQELHGSRWDWRRHRVNRVLPG